jgi:hypothetical protein
MNSLDTRHLFTIKMTLHPAQRVGSSPLGRRSVIAVSGGTFEGERMRGTVQSHAGSDWLLERGDGSFQQDARLTLQTEDEALILMSYRGVRWATEAVSARLARGESVDAHDYYLRTAPFYETAATQYAWLNRIVSVGVGARTAEGVTYQVFEVL